MKFYALLLGVLVGTSVCAETVVDAEKLRTYGAENPTLIYVFTSPACPHCAAYHAEILPVIKKQFSDTGLAQIKIVDMVGDKRSMKVAQLARCMTDSQYTKFMETVYQKQSDWAYGDADTYEEKIISYATDAGLTAKSQKACLDNEKLADKIIDQRNNLAKMYRIQAMPTTVVVRGIKSKMFLGADENLIPELEKVVKK